MNLEQQQLAFILRQVADSAEPVEEDILLAGLRLAFRHEGITRADAEAVLRKAEDLGWIVGTYDQLRGRVWTVTLTGKLKRTQLK